MKETILWALATIGALSLIVCVVAIMSLAVVAWRDHAAITGDEPGQPEPKPEQEPQRPATNTGKKS